MRWVIPCDQVRQMTVDAGKMQVDLLVSALKQLGMAPWINGKLVMFNGGNYNTATGQLTLPSYAGQQQVDQIKQAYSAENVKFTAKKYGWNLQQTGEYKYVLTKR